MYRSHCGVVGGGGHNVSESLWSRWRHTQRINEKQTKCIYNEADQICIQTRSALRVDMYLKFVAEALVAPPDAIGG